MGRLEKLKRLPEPVGGVRPSFDLYHAYLVLASLRREAPIGRVALARALSLGEASVRTLVRRMRREGLVEVDRAAGILLTREGLELAEELERALEPLGRLDLSSVCGSCEAYGVVVRGFRRALDERLGYLRLRDEIVREGAEGAIIIYCGEVPLLPVSGGFERAEGVLRSLASERCGEGDVLAISICYGGDQRCARALLNAVLRALDP